MFLNPTPASVVLGAKSLVLVMAVAAGACGSGGSAVDAGPASDAGGNDAAIDAARIDAAPPEPIVDAAPRPDALPGYTCSSPAPVSAGDVVLASTTPHLDTNAASCSAGSNTARDTVYRIALPASPVDVIARVDVDDKAEPRFDAVLSVQTACGDPTSEVACSDFGFSEEVEALALTDEAFISVDGTLQYGGAPDGDYELRVATRAIVGDGEACDQSAAVSRCAEGFLCSAGVCRAESLALACAGATPLVPGVPATGRIHAFQADFLQGSCAFKAASGAGEAFFTFTLAATSDVVISTDQPETEFDTVVYLRSACEGAELACSDDVDPQAGNFTSTLAVAALPAGSYLVVVDGSSLAAPTGRFAIELAVSPASD